MFRSLKVMFMHCVITLFLSTLVVTATALDHPKDAPTVEK